MNTPVSSLTAPVARLGWKLTRNGEQIRFGQDVTTFKGEPGKLVNATPPLHPGSSGRVIVALDGHDTEYEWFPSVIGCTWERI